MADLFPFFRVSVPSYGIINSEEKGVEKHLGKSVLCADQFLLSQRIDNHQGEG